MAYRYKDIDCFQKENSPVCYRQASTVGFFKPKTKYYKCNLNTKEPNFIPNPMKNLTNYLPLDSISYTELYRVVFKNRARRQGESDVGVHFSTSRDTHSVGTRTKSTKLYE
jgi:hypothetical protein